MLKISLIFQDVESQFKRFRFHPILGKSGALGLSLLLVSCQTVEKSPLDLTAHNQRWKARGAASEEVQAFANRLSKSRPGRSQFDPSDGVSLNEGKVIALVYNSDLRLARLKAEVTRASADHAGLWKDPTLGVNALKVIESIPDPWVIGSSLSFTIPVSGRLKAEKQRATAAMYAELNRVTEAEWQVTMELQRVWISWSANRTRLDQTQKIVDSLSGIVAATRSLAEQGELPKTEAALFSIEQASRRAELARLKGEVAAGEQELRALMGLSPKAPLELEPALNPPGVSPSESRLAKNNATLNRLRSEYELAEMTLLKEVRKQYPDLSIGPQAETDRGETGIGLVASIPLPILNANKGGIAVAKARRELARAAFETAYERKVGQLAALQVRLKAIASQRASLKQSLIPMIDRQVADAEKLVQLGEGGSLVLLESLVRAHETKLKIITIQNQYSQVATDIQSLMGP